MTFDDLQKEVKELEENFNSQLVSLLNDCNEPVIAAFVHINSPTPVLVNFPKVSKQYPIIVNVFAKKETGMCCEFVYGSNLVM